MTDRPSETPGSVALPRDLPAPGTQVHDYLLTEVLGRGATGVVYRARHVTLDRDVALKMLVRSGAGDRDWLERFRQGARILARIDHPNIIPIWDTGRFGDREYIVLRFVAGVPLGRRVPSPRDFTPAALSDLVRIAARVARALEAVHALGLVHGDVRPSNILVDRAGEPHLFDFDLASAAESLPSAETASLRRPAGSAGGRRPAHAADPRDDIRALGASLHELLTGRHAAATGNGAAFRPPSADNPLVPPELDAIVLGALSPDAGTLTGGAAGMAAELEKLSGSLCGSPCEVFGEFRIIRELGRGGMGVVYLAEQIPLGRLVALKMLPADQAALSDRVERFRREARAISELDHPNIVEIWSAGRAEGHDYFAMRYVEGRSLAALIAGAREGGEDAKEAPSEFHRDLSADCDDPAPPRPSAEPDPLAARRLVRPALPRERILEIMEKVARALHCAHERGIVHRDVKPSNILVDAAFEPFIVDFGLALDLDEAALTEPGSLVGTPFYMSPEQISAGRGAIDRRTDVWALGATLYELLSGRRPFQAEDRETLWYAILMKPPSPLSDVDPPVPRELEAVVMKALEKEPGRRFATALAMAEELGRLRRFEPTETRPVGPAGRLLDLARRHRIGAGFALVLVVVAAALGAGAVLMGLGSPPGGPETAGAVIPAAARNRLVLILTLYNSGEAGADGISRSGGRVAFGLGYRTAGEGRIVMPGALRRPWLASGQPDRGHPASVLLAIPAGGFPEEGLCVELREGTLAAAEGDRAAVDAVIVEAVRPGGILEDTAEDLLRLIRAQELVIEDLPGDAGVGGTTVLRTAAARGSLPANAAAITPGEPRVAADVLLLRRPLGGHRACLRIRAFPGIGAGGPLEDAPALLLLDGDGRLTGFACAMGAPARRSDLRGAGR